MSVIAVVAIMCGPMNQKRTFIEEISVRNCYKEFLLCVEHKQVKSKITDEKALKACILEKSTLDE